MAHVHESDAGSDRAVTSLGDTHDDIEVFSTDDDAVALDRLASTPVDCLVIECDHPSEATIRLLEDVRSGHPNLPCVLFTAGGTVPVEATALDLSAVVRADRGDDPLAALVARVRETVEERRAEVAREQERRRLSLFVSESTDTIAIVTRDAQFEYVSPAVERLLGYDPDDLVGEDCLEYVHPDDRECTKSGLRQLFEEPDVELSDEVRLRHADGSWVWVENRGRNLLDYPEVRGVVVYVRDITERKRREARRRRYESIVENMDDVAYTVDESLTVTYANERSLEHAEAPREAIVGQSIEALSEQMLTDPDDVTRFLDVLRAVLDGNSDFEQLELSLALPGGTVITEIRATPMETTDIADDMGREVVVISRNITDRVEYERALERQNERLDTFSSVVSHDLRGPLSIASGNLELARRECADGRLDVAKERLEAVTRAHTRMGALIDDLLVVARQGTRVENLAPVDLDRIAMESWVFVDSGAATIDIDTGLTVRADEARLRQFFENLFRNSVEHGSPSSWATSDESVEHGATDATTAADAFDDGDDGHPDTGTGVHIQVGTLEDDDGFFVEDDGPGIPADVRDTIFEGGYSTKPNGTGLGLVILREIADAHEWAVTVTDGKSGGARFEVRNVQVVSD